MLLLEMKLFVLLEGKLELEVERVLFVMALPAAAELALREDSSC